MRSVVPAVFTGRSRAALLELNLVASLLVVPFAKSVSADSPEAKHKLSGAIDTCSSGTLTPVKMPPIGSAFTDLEVTTTCKVPAGTYYYRNVNIYSTKKGTSADPVAQGGTLIFEDATIDFGRTRSWSKTARL